MKYTTTIFFLITTIIILSVQYAQTCTETGRDCKYSNECCSGACSALFGFCLHR